jgi:RNA polymerase sigma-70 factor, ECF subfamily
VPAELLDHATDEQLMTAYAAGDERAFLLLFRRYESFLTRLVRKRIRQPETVRDVVQQTFLKLHRGRHRYQAGRRVRPWLATIAANLSRDHLRRCYLRHEVGGDVEICEASSDGSDPVVVRQLRGWVRDAVGQLPSRQREVIFLHWFEGLTYREIAARCGSTPTAIKLQGHRAKRALKELLGPERVAA